MPRKPIKHPTRYQVRRGAEVEQAGPGLAGPGLAGGRGGGTRRDGLHRARELSPTLGDSGVRMNTESGRKGCKKRIQRGRLTE